MVEKGNDTPSPVSRNSFPKLLIDKGTKVRIATSRPLSRLGGHLGICWPVRRCRYSVSTPTAALWIAEAISPVFDTIGLLGIPLAMFPVDGLAEHSVMPFETFDVIGRLN